MCVCLLRLSENACRRHLSAAVSSPEIPSSSGGVFCLLVCGHIVLCVCVCPEKRRAQLNSIYAFECGGGKKPATQNKSHTCCCWPVSFDVLGVCGMLFHFFPHPFRPPPLFPFAAPTFFNCAECPKNAINAVKAGGFEKLQLN